MPLQLRPGEPEAAPWRAEPLAGVAAEVMGRAGRHGHRGPVVLAVDGRSSSGKTTLAGRLRDAVPGTVVVHTDDIAWAHSRFGWDDLLAGGVLRPVRVGQAVHYRPPRWDEHRRPGVIEVPVGTPLLIVEGVGAGRRETASLIDAVIWVQADEREIERRSRARLGKPGQAPDEQHWLDWMSEEIPFLAADRPWERASLIACGTPGTGCDPVTELLVAA
jgi:hypothetical protein